MTLATPSADDRLQRALQSLVHGTSNKASPVKPTVTALCQLAGVSRNSLYRYHGDVLHALRRHQLKSELASRSARDKPPENRAPARHTIEQLAALVEHYYRAYLDTADLLARRERELADLRRASQIKPALLKS